MVFYGDSGARERHPAEVIAIPQRKGHFAYRAWLDAVRRFPGYDGYVLLMDDLLLNDSILCQFPRNVCWFDVQPPFPRFSLRDSPVRKCQWPWYSKPCGLDASRRVLERLSSEDRKTFTARVGGAESMCFVWSDFFYIPRKLVSHALQIFSVCSDEELFLEIAIPLTLLVISNPKEWAIARVKFLCEDAERLQWPDYLNDSSIDGVHPVKLSRPYERAVVSKFRGLPQKYAV